MFFEQFKKICDINGTSPTKVAKELGYSTSKVTAWKNGSIPKMNILENISDYFKVPINYFFSVNENESNIALQSHNRLIDLSETEEMLLNAYRAANDKAKRKILKSALELEDSPNEP